MLKPESPKPKIPGPNFIVSVKECLKVLRKHWRDPIVFVAAGLILLTILVFNAEKALSAYEKFLVLFLKPSSQPQRLAGCNATLEKITEGQGNLANGQRLIARVYRVVPGSGLPVMKLTFEARGGGVSDINIKPRDPKRFEVFEEVIISGGKAVAVQNPRGMYEVTVIGRDPDDTRLDSKLECE